MSLAIRQTKRLLKKQIVQKDYFDNSLNYQTFSRLYISTNENVKAILEKTDISDANKALCVLASGDQAFNLISMGVHDIETFDINGLTEYYVFGIKMALIEKYNYHEYLQIIRKLFDYNTTLEELTEIINDLLPYMDHKYRNFWQNINTYNYKNQANSEKTLNLFHLISYHFPESLIFPNHYLENETNYSNFKTNLKQTKISFQRLNIIESTRGLNKYDLIYLSNVMDYACISHSYDWTNIFFEEFLKKIHNHTTNCGKIVLTSLNNNQPYVWNGSNLKPEKIQKAEIYEIPNVLGEEYNKELLVLSRKKSSENID